MVGGHRVHVLDLDRGTVLRVTLEGDTEHFAWTDDGDSLVLVRDNAEVVIQPANRSGAARAIAPEAAFAQFPATIRGPLGRVSVSGPRIAVERETAKTGSDIVVLRRDSGVAVQEYVATP